MSDPPGWLPQTVSIDGNRSEVLTRLYQVFDADFRRGAPMFGGMPVRWDQQARPGSTYEAGFWHLISREDDSGVRHFDSRRAERLPWCRPVLEHGDDPAVLIWEERAGRRRPRAHVWLERWDYLLVLEAREIHGHFVWYLVTALCVDGPSQRRSLRKRYARNGPA